MKLVCFFCGVSWTLLIISVMGIVWNHGVPTAWGFGLLTIFPVVGLTAIVASTD